MKILIAAIALASVTAGAHADVGAFVGITYAFDGKTGVGITVQATSSRREDRAIAAAGVSFYPFSNAQKFGIPVGVGYQSDHAAVLVGYDFLLKSPSIAGGYVNTRDEHDSPRAPAPAPAPAPALIP